MFCLLLSVSMKESENVSVFCSWYERYVHNFQNERFQKALTTKSGSPSFFMFFILKDKKMNAKIFCSVGEKSPFLFARFNLKLLLGGACFCLAVSFVESILFGENVWNGFYSVWQSGCLVRIYVLGCSFKIIWKFGFIQLLLAHYCKSPCILNADPAPTWVIQTEISTDPV